MKFLFHFMQLIGIVLVALLALLLSVLILPAIVIFIGCQWWEKKLDTLPPSWNMKL